MQKTITSIGRLAGKRNDEFMPGSSASRVGLVWPLTREVASLSKQHDVERRLQRKDLIRNKRAAGRTKDLADVEALESLQDTDQSP